MKFVTRCRKQNNQKYQVLSTTWEDEGLTENEQTWMPSRLPYNKHSKTSFEKKLFFCVGVPYNRAN